MQDAAIMTDNLMVRYGARQVLKGLSFKVPTGSVFGFLGANGAGKTTTIKTLLGFRLPNGGSARVLGYDVTQQRVEIYAGVGYVSEVSNLYEFLSVPRICAFCRDVQRHWNQKLVDHYIDLFGLPRDKRIGRFSKGMKSQLALCLALGHEPALLILDEPTTGLDPVARRLFLNTLVADVAAAGKTVFFSSHVIAEVEAIADCVAVIRDGQIVLCDELDNLRESRKVLRLLYAERPPAEALEVLRTLPGVLSLTQEGRSMRLCVEGNVDELVRLIQAQSYALLDVECVSANLEDTLLDYIKGGQK